MSTDTINEDGSDYSDVSDTSSDVMGDTMPQWQGDPNAAPSPVTLDYWRKKVNDFQALLNTLDPVYFDLQSAIADLQIDDSPQGTYLYNAGLAILDEYETKRTAILAVAQAVNVASDGMNSMGIDFPRVNYGGLNAVPIIGLAAVLGSIAAATAIIVAWINHAHDYSGEVLAYIKTLPAEQQGAALAKFMQVNADTQRAQSAASQSTGAQILTLVKWGMILGAGVLVYKAWKEIK